MASYVEIVEKWDIQKELASKFRLKEAPENHSIVANGTEASACQRTEEGWEVVTFP